MEPWLGPMDPGGDRGINEKPNCPYYLMAHPHCWDLVVSDDGSAEWLPQLSKLQEEPGVQGVRALPGGGADSSMARTDAMDRGFTVLPRELGYLVRHRTRSGGYHYTGSWVSFKQIANRVIWKPDTEAYNEFRRNLLRERIVDPPDPDILELQREREERRIDRLASQQHIPEQLAKIQKTKETLAAIDTATSALSAVAEPKPKRRRKTQ